VKSYVHFLHCYYGALHDVDRDGVFGIAHDVANKLQPQVEAGITRLLTDVPNLDLEHLEYLSDAVISQLRGLSAD
jgi:hypothetical protein